MIQRVLTERARKSSPAPFPTPRGEDQRYLLSSASELARMIRAGEVSSIEVTEAHIRHIEEVNPRLNAVVKARFDQARREAERADALLAERGPEQVGALHGVPCTIKESFALEGMPNTAGLVARRGLISERDATTVRRWREAGAIPMGVTNTPELCMWYETHNYVYGRTNNAYSPAHICGGSSGGEGSIIGAGGSPFGLGSDIGGSIRMPAFFNGVFGHKPTGGLVPATGQHPMAEGAALRYLSTGPLARRAEDLYLLTRLLEGPDGEDPACTGEYALRDPHEVDVTGLRVYVVESSEFIHPTDDMRDALRRAGHALARRGAHVETIRIEQLRRSFDIWAAMLGASEGASFGEMMGQGERIPAVKELWRWTRRRSPHTLPALALALTEKITARLEGRVARSIEEGLHLKEELADLLGDDGVLLYPTFPSPAPRHLEPLLKPAHFIYTAIFNVLEMPSTQTPLGLNDEGLPLGLQIVSRHGNDHLSMAVAMELEDLFGGWVPPWQTR